MTRIFVTVRVKPQPDAQALKSIAFRDEKKVEITVSGPGGGQHEFTFEKVFDPDVSQEQIFEYHASVVDDTLDGFNTCTFAYGQTGAGKTYTVSGPIGNGALAPTPDGGGGSGAGVPPEQQQQYQQHGLVIHAATRLFEHARRINASEEGSHVALHLSVLEIYNETLYDLLVGERSFAATLSFGSTAPVAASAPPKLSIVESPTGILIPGLLQMPLSSAEDAYQLLLGAHNNRVVAEHSMNRQSSRSHVIYTYYVTRTTNAATSSGEPEVVQSKLHMVDLAGSERVEKTGSEGKLQKEANFINKSLTFLEQVVVALTQSKRDHIPYRQSKLTHCLKDSLGGNCKTYMIACIWPHEQHAWETLSTLRFASRMKNVENAPLRNKLVAKEPASAKLLQQVDALKRELAMRDALVGPDAWLPELSKKQRERTVRTALALASEAPSSSARRRSSEFDASLDRVDTAVHSLSHVRLLVGTLRAALWEACDGDATRVQDACGKVLAALNIQTPQPPQAQAQAQVQARHGGAVPAPTAPSSSSSSAAASSLSPSRHRITAVAGDSPLASSPTVPHGGHAESKSGAGEEAALTTVAVADGGAGEDTSALQPPQPAAATPALTFEEFVLTAEGAPLHADYEAAKQTLATCKSRQKKIVALINKLKEGIDDLKQRADAAAAATGVDAEAAAAAAAAGGAGEPGDAAAAGADAESLQAQMAAAKRDYRLAAKELDLCKAQVRETEALKKQALAILLDAYDVRSKSTPPPVPP